MKKKILYILLFFNSICLFAQDIHFSQFQYSPINISPSQTGLFNGSYRFAFNQKTQWKAVTKPFVTYSLSADAKNLLHNRISTGIIVINDRTGDSEFNTFQANITNSFYFPLKKGAGGAKGLSLGFLVGYTQKKLDFTNLQFDNQYNGLAFDPSLNNGESFDTNQKQYLNLNAGATYQNVIDKRNNYMVSFAANNLTNPDEQFINNGDIVKLSTRFIVSGQGEFLLSEKWDGLPAIFYSKQDGYNETIFGGNFRYRIEDIDNKYVAARAGLFYRNQDATFISLGLEYNKLSIGVSYDFNLSTLKAASDGKGGFEFSVIYILDKFIPKMNSKFACPSFI